METDDEYVETDEASDAINGIPALAIAHEIGRDRTESLFNM